MKRIKCILAGLLSILWLASCTGEVEQPGSIDEPTGSVTQRLRVSVAPMQGIGSDAVTRSEDGSAMDVTYGGDAGTRSPSSSAEQALHSVHLLQFASVGGAAKLLKISEDLAPALNAGEGYADYIYATNGFPQRIYVVANIDVSTLNQATLTLKEFENRVNVFPATITVPATGLPMSAYEDVDPGKDAPALFSLNMLVAKLNFKCDITPSIGLPKAPPIVLHGLATGCVTKHVDRIDLPFRPAGIIYTETLNISSAKDEVVTVYLPPNLAGRDATLTKYTDRTDYNTPATATYIEIDASDTYYYPNEIQLFHLALGSGGSSDFNIEAGYAYNITATLKGRSEKDKRFTIYNNLSLDKDGKADYANCYMATAAEKAYYFDCSVKGNNKRVECGDGLYTLDDVPRASESLLVGRVDSVNVLWETCNTSTMPKVGNVVRGVKQRSENILFKTTFSPGNASIAAMRKTATGPVVWSWHIWSCPRGDDPRNYQPVYIRNIIGPDVLMMDRNLGALQHAVAPHGDSEFLSRDRGLFYQWGRKDPFVDEELVAVTIPFCEPIHNYSGSTRPVLQGIGNPTTFYLTFDQSDNDWTARNDNLWGCPLKRDGMDCNDEVYGQKTIYDPCPIGWMVMPAYTFTDLTAIDESSFFDGHGLAFNYHPYLCNDPLFLPAVGYMKRGKTTGTINSGFYWTTSPYTSKFGNPDKGYPFVFDQLGMGDSSSYPSYRQIAGSIRCVVEQFKMDE